MFFLSNNSKTKWVELLREGYWKKRNLKITKPILEKIKKNFDEKVIRRDIAIDTSHTDRQGAVGWLIDMEIVQIKDIPQFLREQGEKEETIQEVLKMNEINKLTPNLYSLWGKVKWNSLGENLLKEEIYKYISCEINPRWVDDEKGEVYEWVLDGAILTNDPVIRGQPSIMLSELKNKKGGEKIMSETQKIKKLEEVDIDEVIEMLEGVIDELLGISEEEMSEEKKKLKEKIINLAKKIEPLIPEEKEEKDIKDEIEKTEELAKKELSETMQKVIKMKEEVLELREELEKKNIELKEKEFEIEFKHLLTEGVPPKSKNILKKLFMQDEKSYNEMVETLKGTVKFGEIGTSEDLPEGLTALQQQINKIVGIPDEVFLKYNKI